jgi:secretion/DNA translocation related TadE-like protein
MNSTRDCESGQVTILVIAIALSILSLLPIIACVAEVTVTQHRLNNLADFTALAGAQDLEFAPDSACAAALNFVSSQSKAEISCESEATQIFIRLQFPVTNSVIRRFVPTLTANSRAGINTEVTN